MSRLVCLIFLILLQQDPRQIVEEAQRRTTTQSQRYEGTLQVIDAKSKITEKRWEYDRLGSHGSSKAVLRFTAPAEVKGVALLVLNHPDRSSDQWMWTPAINRERRIALQDRSTRFFGTDFSFEDLEERDTNQFDYKLLGEETLDGAACWKLQSTPKQSKVSQYSYSYLWVRKDNYALAQMMVRLLFALLITAVSSSAQTFTQRGFLENRGTFYPEKAPGDSARAVG